MGRFDNETFIYENVEFTKWIILINMTLYSKEIALKVESKLVSENDSNFVAKTAISMTSVHH